MRDESARKILKGDLGDEERCLWSGGTRVDSDADGFNAEGFHFSNVDERIEVDSFDRTCSGCQNSFKHFKVSGLSRCHVPFMNGLVYKYYVFVQSVPAVAHRIRIARSAPFHTVVRIHDAIIMNEYPLGVAWTHADTTKTPTN